MLLEGTEQRVVDMGAHEAHSATSAVVKYSHSCRIHI